MFKRTTSQLPNSVTCLNLISGCVAIFMAFNMTVQFGPLNGGQWALIAIGAAAIFDFLDGATARLLHKFSPLGKDLDSLSDMVSFGVAPAMLVLNIMSTHGNQLPIPFAALMIAVCGAIRLATFNTDSEQSVNFRGLPIPANAIFWIGFYGWVQQYGYPGYGVVYVLIVLVSLAMVGRFKMFSLKFKNFDLAENFSRYAILLAAVLFVLFNGLSGLMWTILFYFFLSLLKRKHL
ncbi:MAG: CDP-diacylglycerol--serine O-phosphatidyltransferase [Muribaculaceae bacterium]|nr:CDP-diacylglycerol--serine O-phosphatidyltransferase [Muribaculaceae bacterium]